MKPSKIFFNNIGKGVQSENSKDIYQKFGLEAQYLKTSKSHFFT